MTDRQAIEEPTAEEPVSLGGQAKDVDAFRLLDRYEEGLRQDMADGVLVYVDCPQDEAEVQALVEHEREAIWRREECDSIDDLKTLDEALHYEKRDLLAEMRQS